MKLSVQHVYIAVCTLLACIVGPYQWSTWSSWTKCNGNCYINDGLGQMNRSRYCTDGTYVVAQKRCRRSHLDGDDDTPVVIRDAYTFDELQLDDSNSDHLTYTRFEYQTCYTQDCPDDGWGAWIDFGECSRTCGNGVQYRQRQCKNSLAQNDTLNCNGSSHEFRTCIKGSCPTVSDGGWGAWTEFGECSTTCGNGVQYRQRQCISSLAQNDTLNCNGSSHEFRTCTKVSCPADGGWGAWTEFGECSTSCGNGVQFKLRQCNNPAPQSGGIYCSGSAHELKACSKGLCPVDGGWSTFKPMQCSVTCGTGVLTYLRTCTNPSPAHGGKNCTGLAYNFTHCRSEECAVDGGWTNWNSWSTCHVWSGIGLKTRTRHCTNPAPRSGGKNCTGGSTDSKDCFVNKWSSWMSWRKCSVTCGNGTRARTRTCLSHDNCTGDDIEYDKCSMTRCLQIVDGSWNTWTNWSECSYTCGNGTRSRTRLCNNPAPQDGGLNCTGQHIEAMQCFLKNCPIDGGWGAFQNLTCSVTCGKGTVISVRACNDPSPQFGGKDCIGLVHEEHECESEPCVIDGLWGTWSNWNDCSHSCGNGTQTRTRLCDSPLPQYGGRTCAGKKSEVQECIKKECPIDGMWGTWSNWNDCSHSCGNGTQTRTRLCDRPLPQYGGMTCTGNNSEIQECITKECPIDGGWSDFRNISCSVSCGRGQQISVRYCNNPAPQFGGQDCIGLSHQITECIKPVCAVDGNWSQWSQFSKCTSVCGDGYTLRHRACSNPAPENGGQNCTGDYEQKFSCNNGPCPRRK